MRPPSKKKPTLKQDGKSSHHVQGSFLARFRSLVDEFGSRYKLAKAADLSEGALENYDRGGEPKVTQLAAIARAANVSLDWLALGIGEKRPAGLLPGAALADVVMAAQYRLGSSLKVPDIIGSFPFSKHWLESELRVREPSYDSLLAVQAETDVVPVQRGDLVLIDRGQCELRDGIYLLELGGLTLRRVELPFCAPPGVLIVIGRAVWIGRPV